MAYRSNPSSTAPTTGWYRDAMGRAGLDEHQFFVSGDLLPPGEEEGCAVRLEVTRRLLRSEERRRRILDFIAAEIRAELDEPRDRPVLTVIR